MAPIHAAPAPIAVIHTGTNLLALAEATHPQVAATIGVTEQDRLALPLTGFSETVTAGLSAALPQKMPFVSDPMGFYPVSLE